MISRRGFLGTLLAGPIAVSGVRAKDPFDKPLDRWPFDVTTEPWTVTYPDGQTFYVYGWVGPSPDGHLGAVED